MLDNKKQRKFKHKTNILNQMRKKRYKKNI